MGKLSYRLWVDSESPWKHNLEYVFKGISRLSKEGKLILYGRHGSLGWVLD